MISMRPNVLISDLPHQDTPVEIVERKGKGHPDTICDALAEELSRNLSAYYFENFGTILHHNVDKALLRGGRSEARFGGGEVLEPIEIYLAGRATVEVGSECVPLKEIAVEGSRDWLKRNLHALDLDRDIRISCLVRSGSADLKDVFARVGTNSIPLANDTSIGVGYAPYSKLEWTVLEVERTLTGHAGDKVPNAWGEDVKVMGIVSPIQTRLTIATAMIAKFLKNADAYEEERHAIHTVVSKIATQQSLVDPEIIVNAADDPQNGSYYLTVTGTSAEAGDDGQVGRGNRVNGLITPYRPMTLEAAAGKNPVNHVGKMYNVVAQRIAEAILSNVSGVRAAQCYLVSQIGKPITEPAFADIRIDPVTGANLTGQETCIQDIVDDELCRLPQLQHDFVAGRETVY